MFAPLLMPHTFDLLVLTILVQPSVDRNINGGGEKKGNLGVAK